MSTTIPDIDGHHATAPEHTGTPVVRWPDPSPLRPWWESIMASAMTTGPAVPRSPDPRHPRARDPFQRSCAPTRITTNR
ncbi:hypothetical protein ACWCPQ_06355 [Nocardia sp. NPDC001965]